jgi:hypothetical protein
MGSAMQISVIMPCHNAGRWITMALRSIAQQTWPVPNKRLLLKADYVEIGPVWRQRATVAMAAMAAFQGCAIAVETGARRRTAKII